MTSGRDLEQDAVASGGRGALNRAGLGLQVSRPVVIDGLGGNGQHCDHRQHGEDWHQQENGALREFITDRSSDQGDRDIACIVEGRVAPHPPRQLCPRI